MGAPLFFVAVSNRWVAPELRDVTGSVLDSAAPGSRGY